MFTRFARKIALRPRFHATSGLRLNRCINKKDAQTQTMNPFAEAVKQFGESSKKQEEKRKSLGENENPWGSTSLPSTFHSSPKIAKELKKRENEKEKVFTSKSEQLVEWSHLPPADGNTAMYLEEQISKGHSLSSAEQKLLNAMKESRNEAKKQAQWKEAVSIANHRFHSRVKGWAHLPPTDAHVAEYLEKQKKQRSCSVISR